MQRLALFHHFHLELSAQLAIFLQYVVRLQVVLIHDLLPQIDITLGLDWNGLVLLVPLIRLLRLSGLFDLKDRSGILMCALARSDTQG